MFVRDLVTRPWHKLSSLFHVIASSVAPTSDTSAVVEWWLSEPGTGQVEYGLTLAYGSTTTLASTPGTYHAQQITGLSPGLTYHARAKSVSAAGVTAYGDDYAFTTTGSSVTTHGPRPAPSIPTGPSVKRIGIDTAAVDDSGTTDVTSALLAVIGNLNAGDTLVFPQEDVTGFVHGVDAPVSEYRVSSPLNLTSLPNNVTLWGYGSRIRMWGNSNHYATFLQATPGVTNTRYAGFDLYGANSAYSRTALAFSGLSGESNSGIQFRDHHIGTTMEDIWFHHHNGDCVQQVGWAQYQHYLTRDITLRYCMLEDSGRMGLNPNIGANWQIHHNVFGDNAGRNINAEDVRESNFAYPNWPTLSMHIYENTFRASGWQYSVFGPMVHIYIHAYDNFAVPPQWFQLGPFDIHDNLVTGMQPDGALLAGGRAFYSNMPYPAGTGHSIPVQGLRVVDNTFDLAPWPQPSPASIAACRIARTDDYVTVTGNDFQGFAINAPTTGLDANFVTPTISGNT